MYREKRIHPQEQYGAVVPYKAEDRDQQKPGHDDPNRHEEKPRDRLG